uniref:Secretin/TonB short N-terminal domain protein n=1 Tax=Rhodopseudomonas palustris (strain BisA53) TaxID=316055 RepID=Q07N93_RHOP5
MAYPGRCPWSNSYLGPGDCLHFIGVLGMTLVLGGTVGTATAGQQAWPPMVSAAQSEASARPLTFDIPSQSLETALDAYGAASRTQVLYESVMTAGRRSREVKGRYTPDAALRLLLSGTGLDLDYTAERAITLMPATKPALSERSDSDRQRHLARFNHFLGGVQAGMMTALCRHPEARPGAFRVALQFRVSTSGAITNLALLNSTGKPPRDAAIASVLGRLSFSEPPPIDMPQPITMTLTDTVSLLDRDSCGGIWNDDSAPPQAARK